MSTEIISPPWPSDAVRVDNLFVTLIELHRWAADYRAVINAGSDHQVIPPLRDVPRRDVHDALPVLYHYANYVGARRVRELWDAIVRDYEDAWDTQAAFNRRRQLVAACVDFLNGAWLSKEVREAKLEAAREQFLKESVAKSFGYLIGPVPLTDQPDTYPDGG
jgi:hypothetical protein